MTTQASLRGLLRLWPLILLLIARTEAATPCDSDRYTQQVQLDRVLDGSSLRTRDGRTIRLIGVLAPQLQAQDYASEPYAEKAAKALQAKLQGIDTLQLRLDYFPRNSLQQVASHVFLPDGTNLNAWMIQEGYAAYLPMPPNLWQTSCYKELADQAREARVGMWSLPYYQDRKADEVELTQRGLTTITGQVKTITNNRHGMRLRLSDQVSLWINHYDLKRFKHMAPEGLTSHTVRATGILYPYGSGVRMRIGHPDGLTVVD